MPQGIDIAIKLSARELARPVEDLRRQAPFAMARGLTWLARGAKVDAQRGMDRFFKIRRPWVRNGIRVDAAKKSDWPLSYAVVGVLDDRAKFLEKQLKTGEKRPPKGRKVWSVPARDTRGAGGKVPKSRRPSVLLAKKNAMWIDLSGKARSGIAILKGRGKNRIPRLMWFMPRSIKIKKAWPFERDVQDSVNRNWNRTMLLSFDKAMKTAKRRKR